MYAHYVQIIYKNIEEKFDLICIAYIRKMLL